MSTPSPEDPWGPHPHSSSPPLDSGWWLCPSARQWLCQLSTNPAATPPLVAPRPTSSTSGSSTWQASSWPTKPRPCPCWPSTPSQAGPPQGKTPFRWDPPPAVASATSGLLPQMQNVLWEPGPHSWICAGCRGPQALRPPPSSSTAHWLKGHELLGRGWGPQTASPAPQSHGVSGSLQLSVQPSLGLHTTGSPFLESSLPPSPLVGGPGCEGAPRGQLPHPRNIWMDTHPLLECRPGTLSPRVP